ncbi:MAG: DUF2149 domain-containing protein [Deltaproteobacteria bacterium]|nr:DUF2149 domain-containing protein [Deltaproteobacteria bacterium]
MKGLRFYGKNRKTNIVGQGFEADPLAGLANLLDLCLVFIVGLILTIFNLYNMQELFDPKAETTIMKKNKDGTLEIITKKGNKVKSMKVSKEQSEGRGQRLGSAYRLEDGSFVYVPD